MNIYNSGIPIGSRPPSHTPDIMGTNEEPWMTRGSINYLYYHIPKLKSKKLLEYGSGSSTAWFLKVMNCEVTSIEHHFYFLDNINKKILN